MTRWPPCPACRPCIACARLRRPRLRRPHAAAPPERRRPAPAADRPGARRRPPHGRDRRRAVSRAPAAHPAGRADLHPRRLHHRRRGFPPRPRSADRHLKPPEEMARLFARHPDAIGATAGDRRSLPLLARRTALPISARGPHRRPDRAADAGAPDLGRCRLPLPDGIPDNVAQPASPRARPDRAAGLRAVFPDRAQHRPLRPLAGHPVPGPRLGRQLGGLLRARHHLDRSRPAATCCSSASSAPSAASRPISTSISSMSGARRSSSGSTTPMAATAPRCAPPSSATAAAARCAMSARRWACPRT